jgi:hypothetical protein
MKQKVKIKPVLTKEKILGAISKAMLFIFVIITIIAIVFLPLLQVL